MTAPAVHPYVLTALTRLARLYGHEWSSPEDMQAYADTLADLDPAAVDRACTEIAKRERFWPRPVTIRKAVDFLQRQRAPLPPRGVPEIYTDDGGVTHELFACRECHDRGWLPVTAIEGGSVMSWDQVEGRGEWANDPTPNAAVRRCTYCGKVAAPKSRAVRGSFEEDDKPRRGGW
jgi:hypothetical protein